MWKTNFGWEVLPCRGQEAPQRALNVDSHKPIHVSMSAAKAENGAAFEALRPAPVDRIPPVEQAVERPQQHVVLLPDGAEGQRLLGGLDPGSRVRACRMERG